MAARILESKKDRILTILITPFMSCSAKLPIYIILAGVFFSAKAGTVIFCIYFIGIILSIVTGRLFRSTLLRGADAPFVMELPPYRVPMIKSLMIHMWDRAKMFLKKMGGVILIGSVVVWTLSAFPRNIQYSRDYVAEINKVKASYDIEIATADGLDRQDLEKKRDATIAELETARKSEKVEKSYMGRIGKALAPVFAPLGIDWRGSIAILTGFVAKEIVVSTMGILYLVGDEGSDTLKNALLSSDMTPLSALAIMVFVLLYMPCIATVATIKQETGSLKWTFFSVTYNTSLAWVAAFCVYQGGKIMGFS
jgi:ferrous iron transport protein B